MARKPPVFFHRVQSLLKYVLLGASLTLFILLGYGKANLKPFLTNLPLLNVGVSPVSAQSPIDASQLIKEGRKSYEKRDFSDAVTFWQQAAGLFAIQENKLDQAQVLSFISLAYQQLGQWEQAEEAIKDSLSLLRTEENSPTLAQALTNKGHLQLALGKAEDALKTWQQATDIYSHLRDEIGVTGSLVNQSIAMQELGLYRRACQTLLPALKLENSVCSLSGETEQPVSEQLDALKSAITKQADSLVRVVGLRSLGDVLRVIGKLEESQQVLKQSLEIAKRLNSTPDISAANLSLGNTERALYNRTKDLYDRTELAQDREKAKPIARNALEKFQLATTIPTSKITFIQARLNRLSLLLDFKKWLLEKEPEPNVEDLSSQIQSQIAGLFKNPPQFADLPPSQAAVYAQLSYVRSLSSIKENNNEFILTAIEQTKDAVQQATDLKDQRAEASSLGILGGLYEQMREWSMAQEFTQKALGIAQSIYALDIAYQWQWQLGRIYQAKGDTEKAIATYDAAVKTLDLVRKDLLATNPDVQFSFRDNVAPVYQEFIKLLLKSNPSQKKLEKVIEVNGLLQLAELENFLQCGLRNIVPIDKFKNPPAAVLYMIVLKDKINVLEERIEVIISLPKQLLHHYSVPVKEVQDNLQQLRDGLPASRGKNPDERVLPYSQPLYESLIRPGEKYLPKEGTLVFVLDSLLQNIPMAALHDGYNYLVEKYSIAQTLGSQVANPKRLPQGQLNALIAGLSEKSPSFDKVLPLKLGKLIYVEPELTEIKQTVSSKELLNQEFTIEALRKEINGSTFAVIHFATHGQFSSNSEDTFILAWNDPIRVKQLDILLRSRTQSSPHPIELLVLSACNTASGDKRAALGIAGVAVQAGARSTLASLWNVDDPATAFFMSQFYRNLSHLSQSGKNKADALRDTQLAFLKDPQYEQYKNPYFWAPFILVGNWL